jgi:hypothetical protein
VGLCAGKPKSHPTRDKKWGEEKNLFENQDLFKRLFLKRPFNAIMFKWLAKRSKRMSCKKYIPHHDPWGDNTTGSTNATRQRRKEAKQQQQQQQKT